MKENVYKRKLMALINELSLLHARSDYGLTDKEKDMVDHIIACYKSVER